MSNTATRGSTGLTSLEAQRRLEEHGYNELASAKPKSLLYIAIEVMREPMFLLLISCGALYILLGDYREGIILLSTILLIIFITFYQYQKTEKALDALKRLSSPRVLVMRDGKEQRIPGREVVPGDLMILQEGDRVGADGTVQSAQNLTIDESLLTGESVAVSKQVFVAHSDTSGKVFSGTLVTQGRGMVLVRGTGMNTEFGRIGASLEAIVQDQTRLQKEMKKLIRVLFAIGLCLSVTVVLAYYFSEGNFMQALLNGLAAAMAILSEEFPVVLTVFLALGAWRLSKKNVLTRKPSAIETLGSATVLCSDKTGTITQNRMMLTAACGSRSIFAGEAMQRAEAADPQVVRAAAMACNPDSVDPMEKAILEAHARVNAQDAKLPELVREYPLRRELLAMTIVRGDGRELKAFAKGAPEAIFRLCGLDEASRAQGFAVVNALAAKGYRMLGVATAAATGPDLPEDQLGFRFGFEGLLALEDPIRSEVPEAVRQCNDAGIRVIMITGDFPATAKSIAGQIGLPAEGEVLTGDRIQAMTDEELKKALQRVSICARVMPEQKLRLVRALKESGEIVAMTGDGVNDAPALKAADIGVAMGRKGTDVAREASSLVLLDDNFASIVLAIRSGRRIFDNLQKAMSYIMAIHVPIVGLTLLPAFLGNLPLLLMPLHIVFMELLIDPSSSVAFEYEQEERDIMSRPPRKTTQKFFGAAKILWSVFKGCLLLIMTLVIYFASAREGHSEGEARAITFSALIIGNLALILSGLSETRSFLTAFREKNYAMVVILLSALAVLMLVISVPALQQVFAFEFPGFAHFVPSFIGAALILFSLELVKWISHRAGNARRAVKQSNSQYA